MRGHRARSWTHLLGTSPSPPRTGPSMARARGWAAWAAASVSPRRPASPQCAGEGVGDSAPARARGKQRDGEGKAAACAKAVTAALFTRRRAGALPGANNGGRGSQRPGRQLRRPRGHTALGRAGRQVTAAQGWARPRAQAEGATAGIGAWGLQGPVPSSTRSPPQDRGGSVSDR